MVIICLMGDLKLRKEVLKVLEKFEFRRIKKLIVATCGNDDKDEQGEFDEVDKERLLRLRDLGHILDITERNNNLHAIVKPYGSSRYVIEASVEELKQLKETYDGQVFGVYIRKDIDNNSKEIGVADLVLDSGSNVNKVAAYIMKICKENE